LGFRNSFNDGFLLSPVGPRQRSFAQWSLEDTIDSGLRANNKQLQSLGEHLTSTFQNGISRLEHSQMQSAKLLQREMQYQADQIAGAVEQGSADVVAALQRTCDYLGGELCELRWATEKQTEVSRQILQVLLDSLGNESRQLWTQGVRCYETGEYDIAKERFDLALSKNRTNYFAYQYLGFIAVHKENSSEALKNFDLARKFAESGYHRALALSHLARSLKAIGDLPQAVQSLVAATDAAPEHAKFWYECAVFQVAASNVSEAIRCLRQAISSDWMYWSIAASDANIEPIRDSVDYLLAEMREEQRRIARQSLDTFAVTLTKLAGMGITGELADYHAELNRCDATYREGTVFAYRNLVEPCAMGRRQALQKSVEMFDQRITANRSALSLAQRQPESETSTARNRIQVVSREADLKAESYKGKFGLLGCVGLFFLVVLLALAGKAMGNHDPVERTGGIVAFIGLLILMAALVLRIPIMQLMTATLPARRIRAQIPTLRQEADRIEKEARERLARETEKLGQELARLEQHKTECQKALAG
jgi:tetratricopeptide (TPR) repeat protein